MLASIFFFYKVVKKSWRGRELLNVNSNLSFVHQHGFLLLYVKELLCLCCLHHDKEIIKGNREYIVTESRA